MRNMCLGITAIAVTVGMVSVGAQGRNFSGTWVVDTEKTTAALAATMSDATGTVVARGGVAGGGERRIATGGVVAAGGGGAAAGRVATGGSEGGTRVEAGGGGGRGGAMRSTDTVITIDGTTFSTDMAGVHTSYPLNGSEVTVQVRNTTARARASWKGDTLMIEQTIDGPNGPVTSTTSWFMEGDSLVRETTRKTYYKRK